MTGTPEGSTESGFMEKPGFEPATPGLQGIVLIHYSRRSCHNAVTNVPYEICIPLKGNYIIIEGFYTEMGCSQWKELAPP